MNAAQLQRELNALFNQHEQACSTGNIVEATSLEQKIGHLVVCEIRLIGEALSLLIPPN